MTARFHLVGVDPERSERRCPEVPARVIVPPLAIVDVEPAAKVKVGADEVDFVKL